MVAVSRRDLSDTVVCVLLIDRSQNWGSVGCSSKKSASLPCAGLGTSTTRGQPERPTARMPTHWNLAELPEGDCR
jgi:hypothetical protein